VFHNICCGNWLPPSKKNKVKKVGKSWQKSCQKDVKKMSKNCQKVVKKLSKSVQKSCQKVVKKFSKKLSKSYEKFRLAWYKPKKSELSREKEEEEEEDDNWYSLDQVRTTSHLVKTVNQITFLYRFSTFIYCILV
jgi:RNA processing factor Prp31